MGAGLVRQRRCRSPGHQHAAGQVGQPDRLLGSGDESRLTNFTHGNICGISPGVDYQPEGALLAVGRRRRPARQHAAHRGLDANGREADQCFGRPRRNPRGAGGCARRRPSMAWASHRMAAPASSPLESGAASETTRPVSLTFCPMMSMYSRWAAAIDLGSSAANRSTKAFTAGTIPRRLG